MVSSINGTDDESMKQMMALMFQKMGAADTDGTKGLSKSELSSIDAGDDSGGSAFLKSLSDQFDELDTDANGQLSSDEIAKAKPPEPMGPPPGLAIESSDDSSSYSDLLEQIIEASKESFVSSFDDSNDTATDASKAESLIASADSDGSSGLSLDELSSADSSGSNGKTGFVNDLIKNFDNYDLDGDGQLSKSELETAMPDGPFSRQEEKAIVENSDSNSIFSKFESSLSNLGSSSLIQKLISSYQSGDFADILSSLNIAV